MRLTGERPIEGKTPDSLLALHAAGYREVVARLGPGALLDLGCGLGDGSARFLGGGRRVTGVDYDPATAALAAELHPGLTATCSDAAALALRSGAFDWACSSHLIEHFRRARAARGRGQPGARPRWGGLLHHAERAGRLREPLPRAPVRAGRAGRGARPPLRRRPGVGPRRRRGGEGGLRAAPAVWPGGCWRSTSSTCATACPAARYVQLHAAGRRMAYPLFELVGRVGRWRRGGRRRSGSPRPGSRWCGRSSRRRWCCSPSPASRRCRREPEPAGARPGAHRCNFPEARPPAQRIGRGAAGPRGRRRRRPVGPLLVVLLLDVDVPHVVGGALHDVLDRQHGRVHRVVLVVVAVHAVAPDRLHVGGVLAPATPAARRRWRRSWRRRRGTPSASARRSRPRPRPAGPGRSCSSSAVARRTSSSSGIVHHSSPSLTKYSSPRQVRPSFTMYGDQAPKFWMRPELDLGHVDVDPVVGEGVALGDDEGDGQEVAVAQGVGRGQHLRRRRRVHRPHQRAERHRRDDRRARVAPAVTVGALGRRRCGPRRRRARRRRRCGSISHVGAEGRRPGRGTSPTSSRGRASGTGTPRSAR